MCRLAALCAATRNQTAASALTCAATGCCACRAAPGRDRTTSCRPAAPRAALTGVARSGDARHMTASSGGGVLRAMSPHVSRAAQAMLRHARQLRDARSESGRPDSGLSQAGRRTPAAPLASGATPAPCRPREPDERPAAVKVASQTRDGLCRVSASAAPCVHQPLPAAMARGGQRLPVPPAWLSRRAGLGCRRHPASPPLSPRSLATVPQSLSESTRPAPRRLAAPDLWSTCLVASPHPAAADMLRSGTRPWVRPLAGRQL